MPAAAARAEARLLEGRPELVAAETDQILAPALARGPVPSTGEILVLRAPGRDLRPAVRRGLPEPWALELAGRHREASEAWGDLGFPYERAQAMVAGGDDDLARAGLAALQDLGVSAAATAAARHLRERGLQGTVPRATRRDGA